MVVMTEKELTGILKTYDEARKTLDSLKGKLQDVLDIAPGLVLGFDSAYQCRFRTQSTVKVQDGVAEIKIGSRTGSPRLDPEGNITERRDFKSEINNYLLYPDIAERNRNVFQALLKSAGDFNKLSDLALKLGDGANASYDFQQAAIRQISEQNEIVRKELLSHRNALTAILNDGLQVLGRQENCTREQLNQFTEGFKSASAGIDQLILAISRSSDVLLGKIDRSISENDHHYQDILAELKAIGNRSKEHEMRENELIRNMEDLEKRYRRARREDSGFLSQNLLAPNVSELGIFSYRNGVIIPEDVTLRDYFARMNSELVQVSAIPRIVSSEALLAFIDGIYIDDPWSEPSRLPGAEVAFAVVCTNAENGKLKFMKLAEKAEKRGKKAITLGVSLLEERRYFEYNDTSPLEELHRYFAAPSLLASGVLKIRSDLMEGNVNYDMSKLTSAVFLSHRCSQGVSFALILSEGALHYDGNSVQVGNHIKVT